VPFAGIAFLWFIGVIRDRLGKLEDQFFATVVLGSGVLYLGMVFVNAALAGGLLANYAIDPEITSSPIIYAWLVMYQIVVPNARMAGVFMISWAPSVAHGAARWVAVDHSIALVSLLSLSPSLWVLLLFPACILHQPAHPGWEYCQTQAALDTSRPQTRVLGVRCPLLSGRLCPSLHVIAKLSTRDPDSRRIR
jgi:hypothetical protein